MLNFILDLIFPKFCVGCNKFDTHLCQKCFEKINFYPFPLQPEINACALEKIILMAEYGGVIKKLITALKYQSVRDIGQTLAKMIYYTTNFPRTNVITSVPLHKKRKRQRGFNQATEIAIELSNLTNIPFIQLLKRTKYSKPQAQITDKTQRLSHLENTFTINQSLSQYQSVLIIDDVTTTGTTLNECAKVLKQNGHQKIYGLAVAHGN
ncbi:ComF family protein [Patescibacteria group bacterium]|nr:ComF family protein [Patescibacteria group bacterium]